MASQNTPPTVAQPQPDGAQHRQPIHRPAARPLPSLRPCGAAALILLTTILNSSASSVTLTASDAGGTTSYNTAGHWSNAAAPAPGNAYSVGSALTLRTPAPTTSGNNYFFLGDSLTINSGGRLLGKVGNNVGGSTVSATITVTNLIMNGGMVDQADVTGDNTTLTVAGNVSVTAASITGAIGGTGNGSASFDTLDYTATLSGSGALLVSGPVINLGQDTGVVQLSAANPYSGTITVSNGNSGVIASTVNRILQLNNVDALSNATLNLAAAQGSPVSFAASANSGPFNVGALTGNTSQSLADTAGSPVILSLGANNASCVYGGILSGVGSLTKTGSGTLTFTDANTYAGDTVVSAGTLGLNNGGSLASGNLRLAAGATLDVSSQTTPALAVGQNLLGAGSVNGSLTTSATSKIYPGTDGTAGTLTFDNNLTNVSGSAFNLDVSTSASSGNDHVIVTGALALNNNTLNIQPLAGGASLDTSADYVLITAASITGTPNSAINWVGAEPANGGNYTVVATSTQVKLHYSAGTPLTATGSANPSTVARNQSTLLTITVTPATFPSSTGINVTANLTPLGGSATQVLYDDGTHGDVTAGDGIYSVSVPVASLTMAGTVNINASVTDAQSRLATATIALSVVTSSVTWNGAGASDSWNNNANWVGGSAPGYVGDTLTFGGTRRLTPSMDANYSVTDVTFDSSAGNFVLGTTGGALTLTGGGVVNNSTSPQTVNLPITTAAAETFNAANGDLIFDQAVTNGGNWLTVGGNDNTVINGGISGTGGLNSGGNGSLILNGTNSFTGGLYISSGTLQIGAAGQLGAGNYSGNITNLSVLQYSSSATQTLSGVISFNGVLKDGPGTLTLTGVNTYYGDTTVSNGVFQIGGSGSLENGTYEGNIVDNGIVELSSSAGQVLQGVISGSGGVVKDGSGIVTFAGPNTYTGPTVVSGGTLILNPVSVGYGTLDTMSVSNAAVTINANASSFLPVGSLVLNNNSIVNLTYDFSGGSPTVAALEVLTNLTAPGTNITINVNGYGVTVGQFPLIASPGTPLPNLNNFRLGAIPPGTTASLVNNTSGHTIDLKVATVTTATWIPLVATDAFGTSSFNTGTGWSDGNPPNAANGYYTKGFALRSPADVNPYTFGGFALSIDAGGRLLMKGINGQVLTVNNLILNGGLVDYANLVSDNFTETLNGNISLQPGVTNYFGALGDGTTAETLFVTAPISGSGNLAVGGPLANLGQDIGTVVLSGTSTYNGSTTVASGTLLVNGSVSNTVVTVDSTGTLGGTGTIGGTVTVQTGGTLAPGTATRGALTASLGTLTVHATVTVSGTTLMKIDRSAVTNSDRLAAPGVVVNSGAILTVSDIGSTNLVAGDTFTLFSTPISGTFTTVNLPALPGTNVFWTNNLALNGTIAVASTVTVNTNSPYVTNLVSGGNLTLSWPLDHIGWTLQVQTNDLGAGLGTNWVDVPGSSATNAASIPVNTANGAVFYRLKL